MEFKRIFTAIFLLAAVTMEMGSWLQWWERGSEVVFRVHGAIRMMMDIMPADWTDWNLRLRQNRNDEEMVEGLIWRTSSE